MIRLRIDIWILGAAILAAMGHAQTASSASSSEKKSPSNGDRVVLRVGSTEITEAEFESRIADVEGDRDPEKQESVDKGRKRLGDDYASVLMLSQKAVADHLDATPEIKRKLEITRLQTLSDAEFAKLMEESKPTQQAIGEYYRSHADEYQEVRLRRLFIWKRGPESKNTHGLPPDVARARADAILKSSADGNDPAPLLKEFEKSESGLLDPKIVDFPRMELTSELEKIAFSKPEGKWYQVHDTADSILLVEVVKRSRQQLGEVSSLIEDALQNHNMQVKLIELKKNAGIWMDEGYFGAATGAKSDKPHRSSEEATAVPDPKGNGEGKK